VPVGSPAGSYASTMNADSGCPPCSSARSSTRTRPDNGSTDVTFRCSPLRHTSRLRTSSPVIGDGDTAGGARPAPRHGSPGRVSTANTMSIDSTDPRRTRSRNSWTRQRHLRRIWVRSAVTPTDDRRHQSLGDQGRESDLTWVTTKRRRS
jgi:hypothetical protein